MENEEYQDELEQFLLDEVKQHRMYPSDHVWKNIRTEMHGYRSWPALSFISLFIITALTVSTLLNNHPNHHLPVIPVVVAQTAVEVPSNAVVHKKGHKQNYFTGITQEQIIAANVAASRTNQEVYSEPAVSVTANTVSAESLALNDIRLAYKPFTTPTVNKSSVLNTDPGSSLLAGDVTESMTLENSAAGKEIYVESSPTTAAMPVGQEIFPTPTTTEDALKESSYFARIGRNKNSKFGIQFFITPSHSYRTLSDDKLKEIVQPANTATSAPLNQSSSASVNNVVRHRPAMGLEVGFAVLYNISNRLKFKTGLQLNIRQYHIETFQSLTNDPTSVSLINYRGIENVIMYSPYNNNAGYRKTELNNKLYQASVSMGLQWDVLRSNGFGLNAEASVQPTFSLNNNLYLLSTDLKHYTDGNNFLRKWNINTSVGINATYTSGGTSWQIGPQVRYQHLPTYSNLYPIKEYLLDYGIRIGFTKQLFK